MTDEEIASRLDHDHIEQAAEWAADHLRAHGFAVVHLAPGDMTQYQIVVIAPGVPVHNGGETTHYLVTLGGQLGSTYPWRGTRMHSDYVTTKWVINPDHNVWTGVVLTEFMNALADAL